MTTPDESPRRGVTELDEATCLERLGTAAVARIVHAVDDEPHLSLVNVALDGDALVVRSLPGSRLAAALARPGTPVLVEADALDPATRSGWSVVARGRMDPVLDTVEVARLDRTMPPSWALGDHGGTWLRLQIEELTGRELLADPGPDAA
jgi:uncharacterized protein